MPVNNVTGILKRKVSNVALAEDILKSGHAVWVAPDGAGIVYATFNDSEVEEVQFEVYGQGEGADAYPGVSSMRYPKVRKVVVVDEIRALPLLACD